MGHKIDQPEVGPLQDKLEAFTKINIPKNERVETRSNTISTQTDRELVSKHRKTETIVIIEKRRIWTDKHTKAFNKLNEGFTEIPRLEHYNAQSENTNHNNRCQYKKIDSDTLAKAERCKI